MKQLLLFLALNLFVFKSYSQYDQRHEVRLDALAVMILPAIDVAYEYTVSENSGLGMQSFFRLSEADKDVYQKFSIAPYYRQYFFDNLTLGDKGFFIETLLNYSIYKNDDNLEELGIGFGGGAKWTLSNGFIMEANAGAGRNFKLSSETPDFFFNWGVSLGYRF